MKKSNWKGQTMPRRSRCPECGKKGLGPWKVDARLLVRVYRECRYCHYIEKRKTENV